MKLLYILNVANKVNNFSYTSMQASREIFDEFHIAGNWSYESDQERKRDEAENSIHIYQVDIDRSPYSLKNIKAYKQILEIIKKQDIDYIHCNTPVGGLLGRLAGKKCKVKKIIYQAHGFHFFKGAPLINWLVFYPIERWLARMTDAIITINKEDYELAQKFRLKSGGKVYYLPGIGIDANHYSLSKTVREERRKELNISDDDIVLVSMGDLIKRKNYSVALEAIAKADNKKLKYLICGKGTEAEKLEALAKKLGINNQVHFLGYRSDIRELLISSDLFLFTTKQEGLPRSLMEAMSSGLPSIVSDIRGNVDLITDGAEGILCPPTDSDAFAAAITKLAADSDLRIKMGNNALEKIKQFDVHLIEEKTKMIYKDIVL